MKKKDLASIIYISILIIVWGSIGSLIDYPLLKSGVYDVGSIGQILTFSISAIVFIFIGIKLFPIVIKKIFKDT